MTISRGKRAFSCKFITFKHVKRKMENIATSNHCYIAILIGKIDGSYETYELAC